MSENSDGFTFVEMTIVLSIAFALSVIILPIGYKMTKHQIERDAIDLLINTIYTMQSYAMGHEQYTILRFITDTEVTTYQVVTPNQKVLIERELPKGMTIAGSSPMKTVEFHPNGDILKGGGFNHCDP